MQINLNAAALLIQLDCSATLINMTMLVLVFALLLHLIMIASNPCNHLFKARSIACSDEADHVLAQKSNVVLECMKNDVVSKLPEVSGSGNRAGLSWVNQLSCQYDKKHLDCFDKDSICDDYNVWSCWRDRDKDENELEWDTDNSTIGVEWCNATMVSEWWCNCS